MFFLTELDTLRCHLTADVLQVLQIKQYLLLTLVISQKHPILLLSLSDPCFNYCRAKNAASNFMSHGSQCMTNMKDEQGMRNRGNWQLSAALRAVFCLMVCVCLYREEGA